MPAAWQLVPDAWQGVQVVDPATTTALADALAAWVARVLARGPLGRDERKRIHAALAGQAQRTALMGALNGRDPVDVIDDIEPSERANLLAAWTDGGLPDPDALRPA